MKLYKKVISGSGTSLALLND